MTKINALLQRGLKKFWASKSGGVLIYIAFGLPILLGAMALSIDLGRAFILNTELKDFSDAAALAGAAELDGRDGAMDAAKLAARTGLSGTLFNVQAFATDGGPNITVDRVVLLRNLPADGTDFVVADTATSDVDARFIFVSVVDRRVRSGLSRSLGVIPDFTTDARSIAGFQSVHCRVPAMMMCNPLEADGSDGETPFPLPLDPASDCTSSNRHVGAQLKESCFKGRQMLLKTTGKGSNYVPGNLGLLDCFGGGQGTNCVAPDIASATPRSCVGGTVNLRTGQAMGPVRTAVNTRFDMYDAPMFNGEQGNTNYRPALDVVKGHTGNGCNSAPPKKPADPPIATSFPKDKCFVDGDCPGGRFGFGVWYQETYDNDLEDPNNPLVEPYWEINHPDDDQPTSADAPYFKDYADMTRYEVYRLEIDTALAFDPGIPNNAPIGENGNPTCYSGGQLSDPSMVDPDDDGPDSIDRRVFTLAAVNCLQYEVDTGKKLAGNVDNVPVIGFVDFFLTQPAEGTGNDKADIYGEVIGVATNDSGLKDIVQLYR